MASRNSNLRLVAVLVIAVVAIAVYLQRPAAEGDIPLAEEGGLTQANVLPRLLDLGADKCVPCKMMAPILEEMKETYAANLQVDFIDVWKNPDAAEPYGIKVIPTQIFFSAEGQELFRHEGFFSREDILAKWAELGVELPEQGV